MNFRAGQFLERHRIYAKETAIDILARLLEHRYSWNYSYNLLLHDRRSQTVKVQ
jgi:uncharacterized protein involved in type VI secretion and phage assembly